MLGVVTSIHCLASPMHGRRREDVRSAEISASPEVTTTLTLTFTFTVAVLAFAFPFALPVHVPLAVIVVIPVYVGRWAHALVAVDAGRRPDLRRVQWWGVVGTE